MSGSRIRKGLAAGSLAVLAACAAAGDPGSSTVVEPSSTAPASSPSPSASVVGGPSRSEPPAASAPSATESASADAPQGFARDAMIRALVPGIALREGPGTSHERIGILLDSSRSFVVSDAVEADGYVWQRLAGPGLPPASGCATFPEPELTCPAWRGWAAIGEAGGEAWFELDPSDCPDPATETRDFMMLGDIEALHCYGGRDLEFTAWITSVADPFRCPVIQHPVVWLACPSGNLAFGASDPAEAVTLELFVEPDSGADFSQSGYWAVLVGALDHPSAAECDDAIPIGHPINGLDAVVDCRARFVVSGHDAVAP